MNTYLLSSLLFFMALISSQTQAVTAEGGDVIGRHIFGLAIDQHADPLLHSDSPVIYAASNFDESIAIDDKLFMVSGFTQKIGGVYITQINPETKENLDTQALNLSKVFGFSSPTSGIKTSWNTLLLSEANLADAKNPAEFIDTFKAYFKEKSVMVKPYNYGWVAEVIILDAQGHAKAIKNYSMGRLFASQVISMPDAKTFYMLDAKYSGNLYMFIAQHKNSLAKGTLYAISRYKNALSYSKLGRMSALKMKFKSRKIKFKSIFDSFTPKNKSCPSRFKYIDTVYGEECLKLKKKYKKYANLFEPIRMMALKGISGFSADFDSMKYDSQSKQLIFTGALQKQVVFALGKNEKLNSQFIIQESK